MLDVNRLPHIETLKDLESNFKIFAGPGAGKTTWLVSYLEKVLRNSKRLGKTGRIACITYTNIAVEEIFNGLQCDKSRFDISTIHSFLYRNIIKPFAYLIERNEDGELLFDITKLDGHEEHIVQGDRLRRWINSISQLNNRNYNLYNSPQNRPNVVEELSSLDYAFYEGQTELIIRQNRGARLPRSNKELWIYKSKYWKDGIMHHEDVLYFSYLILLRSDRVVEFIRNRFPYIFVDEFQDTTELQTWILEKICESTTKVGVVGDLAQSIYKFTGAKRSDFLKFKSDDIGEYKLEKNHRSTKKIIDFLNLLRSDIDQSYDSGRPDGCRVIVLIGSIQSAKHWFQDSYPGELLYILTRKNISVSEINNLLSSINVDLLKELYSNDSNSSRARLIHSILMGFKFYQKGDLKNALSEIIKPLKRASSKTVLQLSLRQIAINVIDNLREKENRERTILQFYSELNQTISNDFGFSLGSSLRAGRAKTFYETYTIEKILPYIKVDTKSDDLIRTIHSAKGTEFKNTLVHFELTYDFRKYILDGLNYIDMEDDDGRIYYVGCSRAKEKLLINIPDATRDDISKIENMNMAYHRV